MSRQVGHPLTGFQPILNMIANQTSLKVLTVSSLKGFMLQLKVPEAASLYNEYSERTHKFNKRATNFVIKFAVITRRETDLEPYYDLGKERNKASETEASYFTEAKIQQSIWKKGILGGRPQIAPPITNFTILNDVNANILLSVIRYYNRRNTRLTEEEKARISYMMDYFTVIFANPENKLGIIVMPSIEGMTLGDFLYSLDVSGMSDSEKLRMSLMAYMEVIYKILLLFFINFIHLDLHPGNAMIINRGGVIDAVLIDFGRSTDFSSRSPDYLNEMPASYGVLAKKNQILTKLTEFNSMVHGDPTHKVEAPDNDIQKMLVIKTILNYIINLECVVTNTLYYDPAKVGNCPDEVLGSSGKTNIPIYQMDWYQSFEDNADPELYGRLFDKFYEGLTRGAMGSRMLPETIRGYENDGVIVKLTKHPREIAEITADDFYDDIAVDITHLPDEVKQDLMWYWATDISASQAQSQDPYAAIALGATGGRKRARARLSRKGKGKKVSKRTRKLKLRKHSKTKSRKHSKSRKLRRKNKTRKH